MPDSASFAARCRRASLRASSPRFFARFFVRSGARFFAPLFCRFFVRFVPMARFAAVGRSRFLRPPKCASVCHW
jgi:hypothetical protein